MWMWLASKAAASSKIVFWIRTIGGNSSDFVGRFSCRIRPGSENAGFQLGPIVTVSIIAFISRSFREVYKGVGHYKSIDGPQHIALTSLPAHHWIGS